MALKWTFLAVAVGLIASTLLGLWLAVTSTRRSLVLALVVAGAVLPVVLLLA